MQFENGRHPLGPNATVDLVDNRPVSVTIDKSAAPASLPMPGLASQLTTADLATAIEAMVPSWVEPIAEGDLIADAGSAPATHSAPVRLASHQPTHVRHVWGAGRPLDVCSVEIVDGVAFGRNGARVAAAPDGAEWRLISIG